MPNANNIFKPEILNINLPEDLKRYETLKAESSISVFDEIWHQLKEYVKCLHPSVKFTPEALTQKAHEQLGSTPIEFYGSWVYYPWSKRLVHVLSNDEFATLRTNRNCYKITPKERDELANKKIGVVGLSVGQSIALTLAMERSFGELRLADFDTLDLSNLNRIRAGVHNLGLNKAVVTAREIYEIDPYLNITCFFDGLTEANLDEYFTGNGKLDLLVDECDSLDIKILCRHKARALKIPVIMDTSDRGMLDIERFDLEPERQILHGLVGDLDPQKIKGLTNEQKIPYILPMLGYNQISSRLKASMMEIEETISTWPQLASSVVLGGAVSADIARKILLNQSKVSGRFYIDLDELIEAKPTLSITFNNPFKPLTTEESLNIIHDFEAKHGKEIKLNINSELLTQWVEGACLAPSGGNCQPWKWVAAKSGYLYLLFDKYYAHSLLDFNDYGSMLAFGAAIENLTLLACNAGYQVKEENLWQASQKSIAARVWFEPKDVVLPHKYLVQTISQRETNRSFEPKQLIENNLLEKINSVATIEPNFNIKWLTDEFTIKEIGKILCTVERIRLLHKRGYSDFINEVRWDEHENIQKRDGVDLDTVDLTLGERAALGLAKDASAMDLIQQLELGTGFEKLMRKTIDYTPVLGLIYCSNKTDYITAGKVLQRVWLEANQLGLAFHPVSPSTFFFKRIEPNAFDGFTQFMKDEIIEGNKKFRQIFNLTSEMDDVFLFKLFKSNKTVKKSLRRPVEKVFINENEFTT